jgi:UDP-N-acetylmuramoyl-tripeptide--D-alanyl-D-alanine ligase
VAGIRVIEQTSLSQISTPLAGRLLGADADFSVVSIDTRTLGRGDLYVAIKGPNFDGHRFVEQAGEAGAVAAIVSDTVSSDLPMLLVADTRIALGQLGAFNRDHFGGKVLAITGSAGKTTVKEMAAAILRQTVEVFATRGNFNNEIGVPLMLLELNENHKAAVLELGASSIGEIAYTANMVSPDVAIITNAAAAHIEGFGSLNNVVQAKGEIIDGLGPDGIAILNRDDLNAYKWIERAGSRKVLTFSLEETSNADFYARNYVPDATGAFRFELVTPAGTIEINLAHLGKHNVANALAAAAGAIALGATLEETRRGLETTSAVAGRLVALRGVNGATVLDDTYNANPESVRAAVDVLVNYSGRRILVLGDMAELGDDALRYHLESAQYAVQQGIEEVWGVGHLSSYAVNRIGERGRAFQDKAALVEQLAAIATQDTTVLVKGSRSARMEEIVNAISSGDE